MNISDILGLPFLASHHGADVDKLIIYIHYLMGVLFVGWFGYFVFVLAKFRRTKNPKASYVGTTSHASTYVEIAVAVAEVVILAAFAVPLWAKMADADAFPAPKDATLIRVTAEQFNWNSRYAGADSEFGRQDLKLIDAKNPFGIDPTDPHAKDDVIAPLGEMYAPVNKPVIAYITSKDVIHSFKINPLRITQDAIPGMMIPIWFTPTEKGQYLINCAQLCGNSHAFMKGYFNVVSQEDYDKWLAEKSKTGSTPASFE